MQYSLRWILAATAYVALAAAAFSRGAWYLADILWAVSLLAVVFAAILACFARGKRQVKATGFVLASACFMLALHFGGGNNVPTPRLLNAAGIGPPGPAVPQIMFPLVAPIPMPDAEYTVDTSLQFSPPRFANTPIDDFTLYLRSGNAVGMMAFGLLGCELGALAFRAASPKSPA